MRNVEGENAKQTVTIDLDGPKLLKIYTALKYHCFPLDCEELVQVIAEREIDRLAGLLDERERICHDIEAEYGPNYAPDLEIDDVIHAELESLWDPAKKLYSSSYYPYDREVMRLVVEVERYDLEDLIYELSDTYGFNASEKEIVDAIIAHAIKRYLQSELTRHGKGESPLKLMRMIKQSRDEKMHMSDYELELRYGIRRKTNAEESNGSQNRVD